MKSLALSLSFLTFSLLFLAPIELAGAAIYKCSDANGKTKFQDKPCSQSHGKKILKESYNELGLHTSWFSTPRFSYTLICNDVGCTCGDTTFEFEEHSISQLIDAMANLPSAWEYFTSSLNSYSKRVTQGYANKVPNSLKASACRISFYQRIIKDNYKELSEQVTKSYDGVQESKQHFENECGEPEWGNQPQLKRWSACEEKRKRNSDKFKRATRNISSYYKDISLYASVLKNRRR